VEGNRGQAARRYRRYIEAAATVRIGPLSGSWTCKRVEIGELMTFVNKGDQGEPSLNQP
jgi:hypothetical protein